MLFLERNNLSLIFVKSAVKCKRIQVFSRPRLLEYAPDWGKSWTFLFQVSGYFSSTHLSLHSVRQSSFIWDWLG
jgi:hypothetical protein